MFFTVVVSIAIKHTHTFLYQSLKVPTLQLGTQTFLAEPDVFGVRISGNTELLIFSIKFSSKCCFMWELKQD